MQIGIGLSLEKSAILAAQEAVRMAKASIKDKVDLAVVLSSANLSSVSLLKTISNAISEVPIIGSSCAAIISNQGIFKHGLILLLIAKPKDVHFNLAYAREVKSRTSLAGVEIGEKLLNGFQNIQRSFGIVLSDALVEGGTGLILGLQEKFGRSFPIMGASVSNNAPLRTSLYFNREILNDACVGLLAGGKVSFGLGTKHGWKPLGKTHTITSSNGNLVEEIDGKPAARLYQEYLGSDLSQLRKDLRYISILYPIGIFISQEEEYLLRNILSINNNGSMYFKGDVPEGSTVRLMIGTKETCLEATRQAAEEAQRSLLSNPLMEFRTKTEGIKKFALVFSSISRYILLKRDAQEELEIIKAVLGKDTPLVGLYTQGELAPLNAISYHGQVYFHNQTITIVLVGS